MPYQASIPNLFRTEYSKLVAVLCRTFGLEQIELAEDIVGDTFLLAAETWEQKGMPDNQVAWLYTVAKNKARDHLRREKVRREKVEPHLQANEATHAELLEIEEDFISDSQLRMMFAVCHPSLKMEAQVVLALRILCGFSIPEIASALLSNKETINKRLFRAKKRLQTEVKQLEFPEGERLDTRLDAILTTIYLLFNEGYYSSSNEKALRKDLCLEAMRLCLLLANYKDTNLPKVNALLALMCFHASRFEARLDVSGETILYEAQNRDLWNQELVERGEYFLNRSATGGKLSKYHLEAAIAYWHTQDETTEKWESILQLYNFLLQVDYSPMAALNRTYALAKAYGNEQGLLEAQKLKLEGNLWYHVLLGELYQEIEPPVAHAHWERALKLAKTPKEKEIIHRKLKELGNA